MTEQTIQANKAMRNPGVRVMPPSQMMNSLTPKEILGILRRHLLLIIATTVLGIVVGGASWYLLLKFNPKYTATGYIEVLPPTRTDPTILTSTMPPKDILYQTRMNKAILIKGQNMLEDLLKRDYIRSTAWFAQFGGNISYAIDDLKNNLGVSAQRDSDYISVSMTCGSKSESAKIANELINIFYRSQQTGSENETSDRLAKLRQQETQIQVRVQDAEKAIDDLRRAAAESGITMITNMDGDDQSRHTITLKLNQLTIERDKLQADITQIQANIGTLEDLAAGEIGVQVRNQVETDPILVNINERISLLEAEKARKLTRFGENHREVRQTSETLKQTREELATRQMYVAEQTRQANWRNAQDQLVFMQSRLAELEKLRQEAEAQQKDLDIQQSKYASLVKIRDESAEMLTSIRQQIEKINMLLNDPESPKIKIATLAPEPLRESSPNMIVCFSAGPMLGLLLGIALAFMFELLNDIVRTPSDVSRHLRISLLGMIPDEDEDDLADGVDMINVVRQAPYSVISECYRRFRTNLRLSGSADSLRSILVTSGSQGEGKTCAAANLASTFLAEEKKVVFIDTNFRKPVSNQLFPVPASHEYTGAGLSSYLAGRSQIDDIIRPSGVQGLDVIDCGLAPANPSEILGSGRMRDLIHQLRGKYDHVIIDSAPVLVVSDSKMLASMADSTVLVVNAAKTKRGAALRTLRELNECNANITGCVLLDVKSLKGGYFKEMFESYREYARIQLAHTI